MNTTNPAPARRMTASASHECWLRTKRPEMMRQKKLFCQVNNQSNLIGDDTKPVNVLWITLCKIYVLSRHNYGTIDLIKQSDPENKSYKYLLFIYFSG